MVKSHDRVCKFAEFDIPVDPREMVEPATRIFYSSTVHSREWSMARGKKLCKRQILALSVVGRGPSPVL